MTFRTTRGLFVFRGQPQCSNQSAGALLEHGGKKAAASDKMYDIMISDYKRAVEQARAVLKR